MRRCVAAFCLTPNLSAIIYAETHFPYSQLMWATWMVVEKSQGRAWDNSKAALKEQEGRLGDKSTCKHEDLGLELSTSGYKKPSVANACNPRDVRDRDRRTDGDCWPPTSQPSTRLSERPHFKEIRQRMIKQGTSHLPLASRTVQTHTQLHSPHTHIPHPDNINTSRIISRKMPYTCFLHFPSAVIFYIIWIQYKINSLEWNLK